MTKQAGHRTATESSTGAAGPPLSMIGYSVGRPEQRIHTSVVMISAAMLTIVLMVSLIGIRNAAAGPQALDCLLTKLGSQPNSQPIVVTFDDTGKNLKAQLGTDSYSFTNVSISNISISGQVNDVSLGIDRSSLGIVWQQYGADKVVTEFGQCRASDQPTSAGPH